MNTTNWFTWSISLGTVFEVIAILGGLFVFVSTLRWRMDMVDTRLAGMETELAKLTDILIKQSVMEERILQVEKRQDRYEIIKAS